MNTTAISKKVSYMAKHVAVGAILSGALYAGPKDLRIDNIIWEGHDEGINKEETLQYRNQQIQDILAAYESVHQNKSLLCERTISGWTYLEVQHKNDFAILHKLPVGAVIIPSTSQRDIYIFNPVENHVIRKTRSHSRDDRLTRLATGGFYTDPIALTRRLILPARIEPQIKSEIDLGSPAHEPRENDIDPADFLGLYDP